MMNFQILEKDPAIKATESKLAIHCQTIVDVLRGHAENKPDQTAIVFLKDGEKEEERIRFRQLDQRARSIAVELTNLNLAGQRIVLTFSPGIRFIESFLGCLYAGAIGVPIALPTGESALNRLKMIVKDAAPKAILGEASIIDTIADSFTATMMKPPPQLLKIEAVRIDVASQWQSPEVASDTLALLQYTSGSTGSPKGVMVSHGNILHNCDLTQMLTGQFQEHSVVSWLPHYHDMGLIGGILQPLYSGGTLYLMPPTAFLRKPIRWLKAISKYKASGSAAPNFAYELCLRKIRREQCEDLNLSSLKLLITGAEPVRAATVERFVDFFAPMGLSEQVLTPCYGMAETTLIITGKSTNAQMRIQTFDPRALENGSAIPSPDVSAQQLVGCGTTVGDMDVAIVDPDTFQPVSEGTIGEIWVNGPSVAQGYWNKPDESREAFDNRIAGRDESYLRTGDLGFIYHQDLFISGRTKDLIIIRGKNIYPQDIEAAIEMSHPAFETNSTAVIGVEVEGEEKLAVISEIERTQRRNLDIEAVLRAGKSAVLESHGLDIYQFALFRPGSVPKTSSGKIKRHSCHQLIQPDNPRIIHFEQYRERDCESALPTLPDNYFEFCKNEKESTARTHTYAILAHTLKVPVDDLMTEPEARLSSFGIDSLLMFQTIETLSEHFGIELTVQDIVESETLGLLADLIVDKVSHHDCECPEHQNIKIIPSPEERYEPFPLTPIQEAYWLGRQDIFSLGNVSTHGYFEINSTDLDVRRFEKAWQMVIEKHDMLRTIILEDGRQRVLQTVPRLDIPIQHAEHANDQTVREAIESFRREMAHQILAAGRWPLFDVRLTQIAPNHHIIHLSIDLLIADISSIVLLMKELRTAYTAPDDLAQAPSVTFRDYVTTAEAFKNTNGFRHSTSYWLDRVEHLPPAPDLPLAVNPDTIERPEFIRRQFRLNAEQWDRLRQLAANIGVTPTAVILTAYADVLATWSANSAFTLNMTFNRRLPLHPDIDTIIGDFTSIIPVAVDLSGCQMFAAKAQCLQKQLWQDLDHRWADGVEILREFNRRDQASTVSLPVVFTSGIGMEAMGYESDSLTAFGEVQYSVSQTSQVWIDHQVMELEGGLYLSWDSIDRLFPEAMIDDMFARYRDMITRISTPDANWQEIESTQLPVEQSEQRCRTNATQGHCPSALMFEPIYGQVLARESAPAILCPDKRMTYGEMWRMATAVATWLKQQPGVGPGRLVAVLMQKGWEQIPAILGIQCAGAAYLPIDADLPPDRRALLMRSGKVACVLTQSRLENLEFPEDIPRLAVDRCDISAIPIAPATPCQTSEDLAYVIYTSGSTGLPKGVMIDHRGALNTIADINERFSVGPDDRAFCISALNFDLSVYDIFGVLAAGGALVMPDHDQRRNPDCWLDLIEEYRVSVWNSVPALLQMAVDYAMGQGRRLPDSLRLVMLSGDWIPTNLPDKMRGVTRDTDLISLGGATEASIWSIYYPIKHVEADQISIPYGKPLRNQTFHVYDEFFNPRPVWVPGELYIGGIGLAVGYWGDIDRTAERFVTNPHTGERLYKTGDLGRYLPDGNIEFLGRTDFQVKIRGHRIELGEIEAALEEYPGVTNAVVTAPGDPKRRTTLAAYIVTEKEASSDIGMDISGHDGVIMDPEERMAFKVGQHGRLAYTDAAKTEVLDDSGLNEEQQRVDYVERQSYRQFSGPIGFEHLSLTLQALKGLPTDSVLPRYRYPSAGSLYPIQTYIYVKNQYVIGLEEGVYYYDPLAHKLILIQAGEKVTESDYGEHGGMNKEIFRQAAFAIFFVAKFSAIKPLFGSWSRDFCLLEAGYMGQLLMTHSPKNDIGLCPIGHLNYDQIRPAFHLSEDQEIVHSFLGGGIAAEQKSTVPQVQFAMTDQNRIAAFLSTKLPDYMLPSHYIYMDQLPLTANGKVDRNSLPEPDTNDTNACKHTPPRDAVEIALADIWKEVLDVSSVGIHDNFFLIGGDSLRAVHLVTNIKQQMNKEIPLAELFRNQTICDQADLLRNDAVLKVAPPLTTIQTGAGGTPLFLVHPGGGHVHCYADLVQDLGPDVTVIGFQSPGYCGQESIDTIPGLAQRYIAALRETQPQGPYRLGGWCFGGLLAYEMACQLQAAGERIALLAMFNSYSDSGRALPFHLEEDFAIDPQKILDVIQSLLQGDAKDILGLNEKALRSLEPKDQLQSVVSQAVSLNAVPPVSSPDELRIMLNVFKINMEAQFQYDPPDYDGKLVFFQADESHRNPIQEWSSRVKDLEVHPGAGNHFELLKAPNAKLIADGLRSLLDNA